MAKTPTPLGGSPGRPTRRPSSLLALLGMNLAAALAVPATAHAQLSSVKTVFIIVMSNKSWSAVRGNPNAPYINTLLTTGASASNYFAAPGVRLALQNALWLEAGTSFNVSWDADPSVNHQTSTNHFVTLLMSAGISWRTYQEGMDPRGCQLTSTAWYRTASNPFVYFDDVANNLSLCLEHVRPYSELARDLDSNSMARYNFIKPSPCNSMDASCPSISNPVRQGDNWLSQEVPKILSSAAYQAGGALFITWDHSDDGTDGPVGMIVLSPFAKKGYISAIRYTHGSTLRTFQEIFGISSLLGDAAAQAPLDELFASTTAEGAAIVLTWTPAPSATSYNVKRSTARGGPFLTVASGLLSPTYTDRGLASGTTYYYAVSAVNASGEGPASAPVSATPVSIPPAPTNLTAKQAS